MHISARSSRKNNTLTFVIYFFSACAMLCQGQRFQCLILTPKSGGARAFKKHLRTNKSSDLFVSGIPPHKTFLYLVKYTVKKVYVRPPGHFAK